MQIDFMNEMVDTLEPVDEEWAKKTIKKRDRYVDKEKFGRLNIIAGSYGMAGAAVLSGMAAFRTGVGLVTYHAPASINPILQISLPEAMCVERSLESIKPSMKHFAIGPGLGDHFEDVSVLEAVLSKRGGTLVLDADGINDLVRYDLTGEMKNSRLAKVITPHESEAARLLGVAKIGDSFGLAEDVSVVSRKQAVRDLAKMIDGVAVLKGADTLIYDGRAENEPHGMDERHIYVNTTGNPGLATAGSGDVLTGMIGALLAQGYDAMDAARLAVYLHGLAGDIAASCLGETSMTSGDLTDYICEAIKQIY